MLTSAPAYRRPLPTFTATFAVAAGCLNQTIEFDFNLVTEEEILALAEGKSGDLKR